MHVKTLVKSKLVIVVIIVLAAGGGYYLYHKKQSAAAAPSYLTARAERGMLTVSVSGAGQVLSSNQIDIKPRAAGIVTTVHVKNGQEVAPRASLVTLDASDAYKAVRDAQINLDNAKLSLEKLKKTADVLSLLQAENALAGARNSLDKLKRSQSIAYEQAKESKQKANDDVVEAYEDSFNAIANAFLDLPGVMTGLQDILYGSSISETEQSVGPRQQNVSALLNVVDIDHQTAIQKVIATAEKDYKTARTGYDANFNHYKATNRYAEHSATEVLLTETSQTAKMIAQAVKSASNMMDAWADYRTQQHLTVFKTVLNYQTTLATYTGQATTNLSALSARVQALQAAREAVANAERDAEQMEQNNPLDLAASQQTVKEREASLLALKEGPDALDIQSQELTVRSREYALADAQQKLADYVVRAPFGGVITGLTVKIGDQVSSGSVLSTLITTQKIAELSLNEVDVAKVKTGQKTVLTFDALPDVSIAGTVEEIATIGAVAQGVVSYTVKVVFDTQDERVKPGMSVSAAIITEAKPDVITVPSAAVKTRADGAAYVEVLSSETPRIQPVTVGSASDTDMEITEGLAEGDMVVTQTVDTMSQTATPQRAGNSLVPGLGGGQFRVGGFGR